MTFPRRGTRTIVVDGARFRWHMSPRAVEYGALATVQAERGHGILHYWPETAFPPGLPSPAEAAEKIRFALAAGWDPTARGRPMWIDRRDGELVLTSDRPLRQWQQPPR